MIRCVTQYGGRPTTETKGLKLGNHANKVTCIVHCNSLFVATIKSEMNFSTAFEKEHGVSFLAHRPVSIDEDMILSDFRSDKSPETYQHYIQVVTFVLRRSNNLNIIEDFEEEKTSSRTLGFSHREDGTFFSSWIRKNRFSSVPRARMSVIRKSTIHFRSIFLQDWKRPSVRFAWPVPGI